MPATPVFHLIASDSIECADGRTPELAAAYKALLDNANSADGVAVLNGDGNLQIAGIIPRADTAAAINGLVLDANEVAVCSDTHEIRIGDAVTPGGIAVAANSSSRIECNATGTPAQNGQRLIDLYTAAKLLTPGGSALATTNRAKVRLLAGRYDITAISTLAIDTQYVDLEGEDKDSVIIVVNGDHNLQISANDFRLSNLTLEYTGTGSNSQGAAHITAATTTAQRWTNVHIAGGTAFPATSFLSTLATFAGTYFRVTTTCPNLFSAFASATDLTCSATFEQCEIQGGLATAQWGGGFGGRIETSNPNIFTGIIRRCRVTATHLGICVRGVMEQCPLIRNNRSAKPAVYAGTGGRFYFNRFYQSSTSTPYSIGFFEPATISASHNLMRSHSIDTGAGITNNLGNDAAAFNVADDDYPST
jgi:hypothetical protein